MDKDARQLLTSAETARRLGVKPATLYAYVSRGLLRPVRGSDGRTSLFDPADIVSMADRPRTPRASRRRGGPAVRTRVSEIVDGQLRYQGVDVTELAAERSFDEVAQWLWSGEWSDASLTGPTEVIMTARGAAAALPAAAGALDRVRAIAATIGALDPLRSDLRPDAVAATAATLLAALVDGLPRRAAHGTVRGAAMPGSLASRLWATLSDLPASQTNIRILDTALVLLADHGLTAATTAARLAAAARAHPYAVVGAALCLLDSPAEIGPSAAAHRMLADAGREGSPAVLARLLAEGNQLPGFGHPAYPNGDPRGRALLASVAGAPPDADRWATVESLLTSSRRGRPADPTIHFGLAALTFSAGMAPEAGPVVIATARCAGWIAHALESYADGAVDAVDGMEPAQP